jgi:hypothetical protein
MSRVQRLTVPGCTACNRGWSDDEAHFRNVLAVAGEPNVAVNELWAGSIRRSLARPDGHRRAQDLVRIMEPVVIDGQQRWKIYPARDERVLRIIRKVVHGLSHYHGIETAVADARVTADVMRYAIPEGFFDGEVFQHREEDVCRYWFLDDASLEIRSTWLITFFERRTFIAWVAR